MRVLRLVGHGFFYGIMGLLIAVVLTLGVGTAVSGAQPTYWGTFTQSGCDYARNGCLPVGTWVSDNGSLVKKNIHLDGSVDEGGTVRAGYTPTGFNNDDDNNIVHVSIWVGAQYWLPWVLAVFFAGIIVVYTRKWRREAQRRRKRGPPSHAAARPPESAASSTPA